MKQHRHIATLLTALLFAAAFPFVAGAYGQGGYYGQASYYSQSYYQSYYQSTYAADYGCFGNGTQCGVSFQTISQSYLNDGEFFTANSNLYYITGYGVEPQQGYLMLYKWMNSGTSCPSGGGFGNGTTCGSPIQQINVGGSDRPHALDVFTIGSDTYVWATNLDEGNSGSIFYKWMNSGTSCPSGGGFGNGTTCGSKFPASPPGNEHGTEVLAYVIDAVTYGSYFLGGTNYVARWNPTSNCWGNAAGTCGQTYGTQTYGNYYEGDVMHTDAGTFLAIAGGGYPRLYQWTYGGTNCPVGGFWGDGTNCNADSVGIPLQNAGTSNATKFFTHDDSTFVAMGKSVFKLRDGLSSACRLYKYDATTGTTTVASQSVGTDFTTGALSETTTYTLTCDMDAGVQEEAALCVQVGNSLTVAATDSSAAEAGSNTGTFTITRSAVTSSALAVNYTMSGVAANGNDYASLPGTATIPANQASVAVVLTPTDDSYFEGSETATLTLAEASSGCGAGNSSSADIVITDNETAASVPGDGAGLTTCTGIAGPSCMLGVMPERVRYGTPTTLTWYVDGIAVGENGNPSGSCTISRTADDATFPISSSGVVLWQDTTGIESLITAQTVFTLTCTAPGGTASTTSRTVNLIPSVREI